MHMARSLPDALSLELGMMCVALCLQWRMGHPPRRREPFPWLPSTYTLPVAAIQQVRTL